MCCGAAPRYTTRTAADGTVTHVTTDGRPVKWQATFTDGSKTQFESWQEAEMAIATTGGGSYEQVPG